MSKLFEEEAKERQIRKPAESVTQKIGEQKHDGEATAQAAKVLGVNRQYLSDAKKIHEEA